MEEFINGIVSKYSQQADADKAAGAKAYMLHQFEFLGLPAPVRAGVDKAYIKQHPLTEITIIENIVKTLWTMKEREYQYFAIRLFAFYKKLWIASSVKLMEYCITHKSWWDTVDAIASEWTGAYFKQFPKQKNAITLRWNKSANMWLQRSSILFQKAYKKETDTRLLEQYILNCSNSKEFFIQKAIGWALREHSKTDPLWVKQFIQDYKLAPLSTREALKRINKAS